MKTLDQGGWRRAHQTLFAPPPTLAGVVSSMAIDEWPRGAGRVGPYRVVADDAPCIVWHSSRGRRRTETLNVVGARRTYVDLDISARAITIVISLRPGAIPALFNRPAGELTDRSMPLAQLLQPRLAAAARRLRVTSPETALERLCALLTDRAGGDARADWRARWLSDRDPRAHPRAAHAAAAFQLTDRALHAWSVRTLGMGMKHFLKIRRLHAALEMRMSGAERQWSRIAAAAGYADQPHLVRDCRALLGESPGAYVRRAESFSSVRET
jgi:AraC-like DNA-binding protein